MSQQSGLDVDDSSSLESNPIPIIFDTEFIIL